MDKLVTELMNELVKLQDKKHAEDPEKAKAKRRYVLGLREASKFLKARFIFVHPLKKKHHIGTTGVLNSCLFANCA